MLVRNLTTKTSGQNFVTIRGSVTAISFSGGSGRGDLLLLLLLCTTNAAVSLVFVTETPGCDLLTVSESVVAEVGGVRSQARAEAAAL